MAEAGRTRVSLLLTLAQPGVGRTLGLCPGVSPGTSFPSYPSPFPEEPAPHYPTLRDTPIPQGLA